MDSHLSHKAAETIDYLKDRGSHPDFVGPGASSHYQAGSSESVMYPNKTRMVASMRYGNAPRVFWGDAYIHQVNVVSNLAPYNSDDPQTPYEKWNYNMPLRPTQQLTSLAFESCSVSPSLINQARLALRLKFAPTLASILARRQTSRPIASSSSAPARSSPPPKLQRFDHALPLP
jgi:hypothetical protein